MAQLLCVFVMAEADQNAHNAKQCAVQQHTLDVLPRVHEAMTCTHCRFLYSQQHQQSCRGRLCLSMSKLACKACFARDNIHSPPSPLYS